MSFQEFDQKDIQALENNMPRNQRTLWHTAAYAESLQKPNSYRPEDWATIQSEAAEIYEASPPL